MCVRVCAVAGTVKGFKRNRVGANEHLIEFAAGGGGVQAVKLKETPGWTCNREEVRKQKSADESLGHWRVSQKGILVACVYWRACGLEQDAGNCSCTP